ncbi:nitrate reductase [Solemya pervernicosa gill symbiont]|uniref:Periplasmic nitrate reductase, electron transfer subunit n=2 Tax=Gammaproteobacteria incertae sedis TaxID=118884 RepID=A0A1T2L0G7_9GAMM|nr:nitrate reductase cytochrome c-type subunit [Candidatus Reidiella endopervernicosa]OOZ38607.1 nitrate reductase [Solemya pervernicosa gill symbiont]QKQ24944.1 nitrate reductase cytochrome c-type subunit [Candidatus Reidiella endopervernicosa]
MKKIVLTAVLGMFAVMAIPFSASADVTSLRGDLELDADSKAYEKRKQVTQKGGFERSFKLQPPMIPHKVDKDKITLKTNTCMRCHSAANYKKEKAPMTGESHFLDRDGNKLKKVSARRYFCNQCHAPQQSADPLVENQFVGAK